MKGCSVRNKRQLEEAMLALAKSISAATSCRPQDVWCTFTNVTAITVGLKVPEWENRIVYADILMRPRGGDVAAQALEAAASTISEWLGVPLENVWVRLAELPSGSVFAGGRLI
jgi:hypothetical protein